MSILAETIEMADNWTLGLTVQRSLTLSYGEPDTALRVIAVGVQVRVV